MAHDSARLLLPHLPGLFGERRVGLTPGFTFQISAVLRDGVAKDSSKVIRIFVDLARPRAYLPDQVSTRE